MGSVNPSIDLAHDGDIAIVTIDNPPVNALKHEVRAGLIEAFQRVRNDAGVKAAVLACAGPHLLAGADITEFGKPSQPPRLIDVIADDRGRAEADRRGDARHAARRRASSSRSAAISASRRRAPGSACPRSSSASFPAPAARSGCRASIGAEKALPMILSGDPIAGRGRARAASSTRSSRAIWSRARSPSPARSSPRSARSRASRDRDDEARGRRADPRAFDEIAAQRCAKKRARPARAGGAAIEAVRRRASTSPFDEGAEARARAVHRAARRRASRRRSATSSSPSARPPRSRTCRPDVKPREIEARGGDRRRHHGRRHRDELRQCRHPGDARSRPAQDALDSAASATIAEELRQHGRARRR